MNQAQNLESQIQDAISDCYASPLKFVLTAFDWGGPELAKFQGPDDWQISLLEEIAQDVLNNRFDGATPVDPIQKAISSGHGIGKSAVVAWVILWIMSTRPMCKGTVTANTYTQLETKTWPELAKWHSRSINKHWFKLTTSKMSLTIRHVDYPTLWYATGQTCKEENSESFAGQHSVESTSFYVFDEASAIPDKIWEVAEGGLTDGEPMWFAFGNPTQNTGRFYDCFYHEKLSKRWDTKQIDSRDVRITNKKLLGQWVKDYGEDSDFVRVRIRGVFPRSGDHQFISMDSINESLGRELIKDRGAPIVVGVDVARFGSNNTVIFTRQGRDAKTFPIKKFNGLDTMQVAQEVANHINYYKPDNVFVDGGGVGGGVVDRLKQLGFRVTEVNSSSRAGKPREFGNLRAEMWNSGKKYLEQGCIGDDPDLVKGLRSVEYFFDAQNRLKLEGKEDMRTRGVESPDTTDAFMLTFAAPVAQRGIMSRRPKFAESGYDEFAM